MNTTTNSLITFTHVHVLYVTTAGLWAACEHVVNLAVGVAVAYMGMNTARIALQTARVNRLAAVLGASEAHPRWRSPTDPMQAFTQSLSRPRASAKVLSRPWPKTGSHHLTRASLH